MISNQILQSTVDGMKRIAKIDLCVMDIDGNSLAGTFLPSRDVVNYVQAFAGMTEDRQSGAGCRFYKICAESQWIYVLAVRGEGDAADMIGEMASFQIQNLMAAYEERSDKDHFYKNLLLDNLLLVDIYNRAKKMHIDMEVKRVIFIVEIPEEKEMGTLEQVRAILGSRGRDFVTAVDERNAIIIKEVDADEDYDDLEKYAQHTRDILASSGIAGCHVSYGTIITDMKEVSKSYKEAKLALDVGKIFFEEKDVIAYNTLGIGRLIYQLPVPLCKMFIHEIFEGKSPDDFDEETLTTINKFFENNLNVSETSRQLYIHRNTLVYRLDKIYRSTGLDLRVFEDAITFKIALMVVKYMKYMETLEY